MGIPGDSLIVGVGITTRDRWTDLASSLDRLRSNAEFAVDEIIVIDDGSKTACPEEIKARFPDVTFLRDEAPEGVYRPAQPARADSEDRLLSESRRRFVSRSLEA